MAHARVTLGDDAFVSATSNQAGVRSIGNTGIRRILYDGGHSPTARRRGCDAMHLSPPTPRMSSTLRRP
jgi:hypothetical protein